MLKFRLFAALFFVSGFALGFFAYAERTRFPFRFGLDLAGGTQLVYKADVSSVAFSEIKDSLESLRDVVERRVNLFGVAEPRVQTETYGGFLSEEKEYRLIVELPGITDVDKAVLMIGETPLLEFRIEKSGASLPLDENADVSGYFTPTTLTGRFLEKATLQFDGTTRAPSVSLRFNAEGKKLFAAITRENVGKVLAIYLDGAPLTLPVIREEIASGDAEITGVFTAEEAKTLVGRLNTGALPVAIELIGSETIGASLGSETKQSGLKAGALGLLAVALFMILWYRIPGVIASCALGIYVAITLALFKLIPVTLTAAGIAGFILSIGMAVDANILVFARMKEELRSQKSFTAALEQGFSRAWPSIRDGNGTTLLVAFILFQFGSSFVKGFAVALSIGIIVSMISALMVTRVLLRLLRGTILERIAKI
ncbi:MAG: protein translocase subunit SecD [Parcubacteria group bacterium]|nr:protein translocase subunit SecD [Parcubacteria group bacterium]